MKFVARAEELAILKREYTKKSASFVAVYGRRRIGKTELIDHFLKSINCFSFSVTGAYESTTKSHLANFANKLSLAFGVEEYELRDWDEAFRALREQIEKTKLPARCKFSIFIDELPWLAEMKNGGFKGALSLFWNDFASKRDDIFLITCGSATSWIIDHIIEDNGSLANRVTAIIHLQPFTLGETQAFFKSMGFKGLSHKVMVDYYMVLGGVAHYLKLLDPKASFVQNIQRLFFTQNGLLRTEYSHLFRSLFKNHKVHELIVKYLSRTWTGMSLSELGKKRGLQTGAVLSNALRELEASGFLVRRTKYGQVKRDTLYSLNDPFIYFFTQWVNDTAMVNLIQNPNYFQKTFKTPSYLSWSGFAFENICHMHILQIKEALGISGVVSSSHYWRLQGNQTHSGAQIDILLQRDDEVINIIECKYHNKLFVLDKKYAKELASKEEVFREHSSYTGAIQIIMLSVEGLKKNSYYDEVVTEDFTVEVLF